MSIYDHSIEESIAYLNSDQAIQSIRANAYWPKWNSPWWHMSLLKEMDMASKIPESAIHEMTAQLKVSPLTIFPIHPHELSPGIDPFLETHCHCALGNIYQVLAARGVDVDQELPWIKSWFFRYQVSDGGLNCDNEAYLKTPSPSSMVGTIAPLEAVLLFTKRNFTDEEIKFLDSGAKCLIERELMFATTNSFNAEEKEDEQDWLKLCFPRFYFYDVLRGLSFILKWAKIRKQSIPKGSTEKVIKFLNQRFPDQQIKIERRSFEGTSTLLQNESKKWERRKQATFFPLLDQVSEVGTVSPFLTSQWNEARNL